MMNVYAAGHSAVIRSAMEEDLDFHIFYVMKLKFPERIDSKSPLRKMFWPEVAYYTVLLAG